MNSTQRYQSTYGTTGSYIEQGSVQDAHEAHLEARRAAWKRSRLIHAGQVIFIAVSAVGFAGALGWAVFGVLMGYGQ